MQLNECKVMRRYESMLFNSETTSREDYRVSDLKIYPPTTYKAKKRSLKVQNPILKDVQTLADFKYQIPFTLFLKRKEIIQTDPRTIQESHEELEDHEREEVQKTRPRVCMFSALPLDDIEEPARQLLVDDMYSTSTNSALQEGAEKTLAGIKNVKAPLLDVYASADVMKLPRLLNEPVVSPEWRMDSVSWDKQQMRAYVDATKIFWSGQNSTCQVCKDTAARKEQQDLSRPC